MPRYPLDGEKRATLEVDGSLAAGKDTESARWREPNDTSLPQLDGRELRRARRDLGGAPAGDRVARAAATRPQGSRGDDGRRRGDGPRCPSCGGRLTGEA